MNDTMTGFNEEQKKAILRTEGYLRVLAGAGTGKTRTLVGRYVHLVKNLGISAAKILCLTFTNKAAEEMGERIRRETGDIGTGLITTFHGFAVKLLHEDISSLRFPSDFKILADRDTKDILRKVYSRMGLSTDRISFDEAKKIIWKKKSEGGYIGYLRDTDTEKLRKALEEADSTEDKIFYSFLWEQCRDYALDFDDLIHAALFILRTFPE